MTREVFDEIAPSWYSFRHWSIFRGELEELVGRWRGGTLLNLGCGHGPDFLPFRESFQLYGVDFSAEMLRFAQKYAGKFCFAANLVLADISHLPFDDEVFDWVIAVATYHHLRGEGQREAALVEMRRVLKRGGEAFITVWNHWQPRFWLSPREVAVPWRTRAGTLYRYYYLFSYGELAGLARHAGFTVLRSFPERSHRWPLRFFSRNICLLVKKAG